MTDYSTVETLQRGTELVEKWWLEYIHEVEGDDMEYINFERYLALKLGEPPE